MPTVVGMDPLTVEPHDSEPSYMQVAWQLRERIQSGEIGLREPLPSITRIQQETGLAVNTVRHAIAVLVDEKYAYTVPGTQAQEPRGPRDCCSVTGKRANTIASSGKGISQFMIVAIVAPMATPALPALR